MVELHRKAKNKGSVTAAAPDVASVTGHALCVSRPGKGSIYIKLRLEDVMANCSSNDSRDNKIGLEE